MPNPNIRFPILRRLVVKNYALFPGTDGSGIDHTFEPGVTVITGINGIGKTTLLNIIYRLLVGPFDAYKDQETVQLTQTRLTRQVFFNYFSKRDRGAGTRATTLGEFDIGERKLAVTRHLSDLSIVSLAIDGASPQADGSAALESEIWRLCGCGSQYDFHLLVRSLIFFMEEKTPVVWDPVAQAEIFRILFLSAEDASRLASLASEIQQQDSQRRNFLTALNRYKKQLIKLQPEASVASEATSRLEQLESRIETIEAELEGSGETSDQLERALMTNRQKLDGLKLDLEEYTRALEHMYHDYFASLFPGVNETAKNVFANLVGDNGCLVCGSRRPGLSLEFQKLSENGACPVCHSAKEEQEQTSVPAAIGAITLQEQNTRIASLKQDLKEFEEVVAAKANDYQVLLRHRLDLESEHSRIKREAERLRGFLPASAEEVSRTQNYITVTESDIAALAESIRGSLDSYVGRLSALREQVDQLRENLTAYFAEYAGS
jgi:DNA repair exonuclease SbcCD ATPase subunit